MKPVCAALLRAGGAALLAADAVAGTPSYAAGAGTDLELSVAGTRLAGNAPDAGGWVKVANNGTGPPDSSTSFTIESPDDSTEDNNSRTVEVAFTEQGGVDLGVLVPDVNDRRANPAAAPGTPLRAGDTTSLLGYVTNWGDAVAVGVKVTVTLPDGSFTVEAPRQESVGSPDARRAAPTLPENVTMVSARAAGVTEVDASDNSDGFAVVVSNGVDNGGGGGAGEGDGGGLPVTGVQTGLLGGIGAAVQLAGALMFVASRRRRVVLVTPGDEKSDAA